MLAQQAVNAVSFARLANSVERGCSCGQPLHKGGEIVSPEIYATIEQIINISCMTNKWMMWSEKNLPEASVYVPSVFQMRDAYSHLVTMMSTGIVEQGLSDDPDAAVKFDLRQFLDSDNVRNQLSETLSHSLRAFFDTSEHIIERLTAESGKQADSFLLLRTALTDLDERINSLRAEKSNSPGRAYAVAEEWDRVLQYLTCAYAFSSYEQELEKKYRDLYNLVLSIEQKFDEAIIKEFDPGFFPMKASLPEMKNLPAKYKEFIHHNLQEPLEDPGDWQNSVKQEFSVSIKKLDDLYRHCTHLMETIPSTALIRKGAAVSRLGEGWIENLMKTLVSLLLSGLAGKYLFLDPANPLTAYFNTKFFMGMIGLFLAAYILVSAGVFLWKKLYFWLAKRR